MTFIHVFMTDPDDAPNTMGAIAAFAEFQRGLSERCADQPVAQGATVVGSYRLLPS